MSKRVAVYARVSTTRQAARDLSIPDQLKSAKAYCRQKGWRIVAEYVDPGKSARDDKRPDFQRMIEEAATDPSPYDVVLVHSLSRFYRDAVEQGLYRRKLERHGVLLQSVTQDFGEGVEGELLLNILSAVDQHQSEETAKHVKRSMLENARQGFWNGSRPPMGYRTVVAEKRGDKLKKRLEVDPEGASLVRLIFGLALEGTGDRGPMGLKAIAEHLNTRGMRTQQGKPFYVSTVHAILTRETYTGTHHFNRKNSRTGAPRPREEWVSTSVPPIIAPEAFQRVQERLKARAPRSGTAARHHERRAAVAARHLRQLRLEADAHHRQERALPLLQLRREAA